jgi:hypothetical protein
MDDEPNRLPLFPTIGCEHEHTGDPGCGLERRGWGWTCVEGRACGRHFDDPEIVARINEYDAKMLGEDDMLDEEANEVWKVTRDGTGVESLIGGYTDGEQRGLVAMHFAQDDLAGWREDGYDEVLWVRRCRPVPEAEPGQAFRVTVARDPEAEREWAEESE